MAKRETPPTDSVLIFCDVQTTGFKKDSEIIQIAAVIYNDDNHDEPAKDFMKYIMPTRNKTIEPKATEKNGFEIVDEKLKFYGEEVKTTPSKEVAKGFIKFLKKQKKEQKKDIILVGWSFKAFIKERLFKWLESAEVKHEIVKWYCDTEDIFREIKEKKNLPYLKEKHLKKYEKLKGEKHDARCKCQILRAILDKFSITDDYVKEKSTNKYQNYRKKTTFEEKKKRKLHDSGEKSRKEMKKKRQA